MIEKSISFIVLAYNDAQALPALVESIRAVLESITRRYEIIIVDDGSNDNTPDVVGKIQKQVAFLKFIRHTQNTGVGSGFRDGVGQATNDIIVYTDGDGQYEPRDIISMIKELDRYQAVAGWRSRRADPWHRSIITFLYNNILSVIFGLSLRDTNSGLKVYSRRFIDAVVPITSDGPFYDAEVLIKGMAAGYPIREIPIRHYTKRFGVAGGVSLRSIQQTLRSLIHDQYKLYRKTTIASTLLFYSMVIFAFIVTGGQLTNDADGNE